MKDLSHESSASADAACERAERYGMTPSCRPEGVSDLARSEGGWPSGFFSLYGSLSEDSEFEELVDEPFNRKPIVTH